MLFSGDFDQDRDLIQNYVDVFGNSHGIPINIHPHKFGIVLSQMEIVARVEQPQSPSIFKKLAAFTTCLCEEKPIRATLPPDLYGDLSTHPNAVIAFQYSVDALHGATIQCSRRKCTVELRNRIQVSDHSWKDIIAALSDTNPREHFSLVSLLYEQLCYRANPSASYQGL